MVIKKIEDIASLITGYNFRTSIIKDSDSELFVLQSKDLSYPLYVSSRLMPVQEEDYRTNAMAKVGDVVLSSRGSFRAAVIKSDKKIIVSSSVYIIRLKDAKILPEYLAIYLNSSIGQAQLNKQTTGVVINTVPIKRLGEVQIKYPDMKLQRSIIDFYENNLLLSSKLQEKADVIKSMTNNLINSL